MAKIYLRSYACTLASITLTLPADPRLPFAESDNAQLGDCGDEEANRLYPTAPPAEHLPSAPPMLPHTGFATGVGFQAPTIDTFPSTECCICIELKVIAYT